MNTRTSGESNDNETRVGIRGELRVRVGVMGGRTSIFDLYQTAPFHLGRLTHRHRDGRAEAILQGVGPGYLPGDVATIHVQVDEEADLVLRGQSAARIYPSAGDAHTSMATHLSVAADASLVFMPGELIPYRDARLQQRTTIDVAPKGRVALVEVLAPGRTAMGESYAYRELDLRVMIQYAGRLVFGERSLLVPATRPLTTLGIHGNYPVAAAIYLVGERWHALELDATQTDVLVGIASKPGFTLVRLLGMTVQDVNSIANHLIESASMSGS